MIATEKSLSDLPDGLAVKLNIRMVKLSWLKSFEALNVRQVGG